jgi:hypothetical protein
MAKIRQAVGERMMRKMQHNTGSREGLSVKIKFEGDLKEVRSLAKGIYGERGFQVERRADVKAWK